MKTEKLLDYFERVADSPDSIVRLRRFILDLAVRGKLVDQDPNDEPASELLKQISEEKARIDENKKLRKSKLWSTNLEREQPFQLPANWQWCKIAQIGEINPRNNAEDRVMASFVPMQMIPAKYGVAVAHDVRKWGQIKKGYTHFAEGDVALAKITPSFENGKSVVFRGLTGGLGSGTTELHIVRPLFVVPEYVLIFLKCTHFIETGIPQMTGTAGQKRVSAEFFANSPLSLPPLAEQHRIVAKVEELTALCDQLKSAQVEREETRSRMTAESFARLNAPDSDPEMFRKYAAFAVKNLSPLTTRPDQVQALRQTILNLAVRGKLVEQDPNDEPASEMLEKIAAEKAKLVKLGKIKESSVENGFSPGMTPFGLPDGWAWSTIGWICSKTGAGSTPRGGSRTYKSSGVIFLRSQNVHNEGLRLNDVAHIDRATHERMSGTALESADLLLNITGGSIGRCCLVPDDLGEANVSQHVSIIRTAIKGPQQFLHCLILSPYFQAFIFDKQTGAGRRGLPKNRLDRIPVALPPLAEQRRIVSKVKVLMALCDRLEASLSIFEVTRSRLLNALLHEVLAA